tara:strand:- start:866 stop:1810 length:945 start_codon:yes stop_codon:yes gene_type:complete
MENSKFKCGIIGTGSFAEVHSQAAEENSATVLSGVCDIDPQRSGDFAYKWNTKAFGSVNELLSEAVPDIVAICSPDETHADIAKEVIEHTNAPRVLVIEKPLCTSTEQLEMLSQLPQDRTRIIVDHSRRFNSAHQRLKKMIEDNELGTELISVNWQYYAGWFHTGIHAIDTLRMLLGDLSFVYSKKTQVDRFENDPLFDVELQSEKFPGARINLEGVPEKPYMLFECEIFFNKGRIRIHWDDIFIDRERPDRAKRPALWFDKHFKADSIHKALDTMYSACADYLNGGDPEILNQVNFEEARKTTEILLAAIEAQ